MNYLKHTFEWEHGSADPRRTGFKGTTAADWHHRGSTGFWTGQLERERRRRERQDLAWSLAVAVAGFSLCAVVVLRAVWPSISRVLHG